MTRGERRTDRGQIFLVGLLFLTVLLALFLGLWTLAELHLLRAQVQAAADAAATAGADAGGEIQVSYAPDGSVAACQPRIAYLIAARQAAEATWSQNAALFAPGLKPETQISEAVTPGPAGGEAYRVTVSVTYRVRLWGVLPYTSSFTEAASSTPQPPPGLCP